MLLKKSEQKNLGDSFSSCKLAHLSADSRCAVNNHRQLIDYRGNPHWHNTALVSRQMMNVGCGMAGVTGGQREVMGKAVL